MDTAVWFTDEIKKYSDEIWIPTKQNSKILSANIIKSSSINASGYSNINPKKPIINFKPLPFNKEREEKRDELFNEYNYKYKLNEDKIWYSLNKDHFMKTKKLKEIPKHLKKIKHDNIFNDSIKFIKKRDFIKNDYKKDAKKVNKCIRASRIKMKFNAEQRQILRKWFKKAKKVYDECVKLYNENLEDPEVEFTTNFHDLRKIIFDELFGKNKKNAPPALLAYEVDCFLNNLKSNETNKKNKNINDFTMGNKKVNRHQTVTIPKTSVVEGIFPRLLGKQNFNSKQLNNVEILCDCKLTYDNHSREYMLFVPQYKKIKQNPKRKTVVALDPGESVFMSFFGLNEYGYIGLRLRNRILKIGREINKFQSLMNQGIFEKKRYFKKINHSKKKPSKKRMKELEEKKLTKKQVLRLIRCKYKKINGLVNELHKKTALTLCRNYHRILIPEFKTQNMVIKYKPPINNKENHKLMVNKIKALWKDDKIERKNKFELVRDIYKEYHSEENKLKSKETIKQEVKILRRTKGLNKKVKFVLNMLSHYKFRQYLLAKAEEHDCLVEIVTEEYTSQACTRCGKLSSNYDKDRIKTCDNCGFKIHRDINGARNILLKNINQII